MTVSAVALRAATSISTGWFRYERPSLRISLLNVAENSSPWRCAGNRRMMRSRSGRKPMSSMRSASSSTRMPTWLRLTFFCST
ncbi:Uncharacterised protein [Bordetella pertussis]|nr:Uncharacterised protein [Bordetella pertussis]CFT88829.1 Uncharacterised protein [Bordetella pertussis]CFV97013.1 Uncharacterised protein [Bordetella pertussis]CFW35039.1 Uncharacterised protein [Bordetella pertussis]CPM25074.1 Uncharacterised protein [Bordetella pertussis]